VRKKIYISNFSGLGNRLEALVLAGMIEDHYGHSIFLHWPEKASLQIAGTAAGRLPPWERIGAVKLRDFDETGLRSLETVRVINLRSTYGPRELQRRYVLPTAARLKPHPRIAATIRDTLSRFGSRPAVAVHIRQGDFHVFDDSYDAAAHRHPAPALWWYAHVMRAYVRAFGDVYFVLGCSGDPQAVAQLRGMFEIVSFPAVFDYETLLPGHRSAGHPVVDLFGLACCTTLIATPTSSFSHWVANALGPRTRAILPLPRMTRSAPAFGVAELWGSVVLDWRDAAERGLAVVPINGTRLPPVTPAVTDWLQ
jgi:hypothetical protein